MPSRCLITGTLASRLMRSIRPLPPRGTITSTYSGMLISAPTAARSVVSTTCTAAAGRPARPGPAGCSGRSPGGVDRLGAAAQDGRVAGLQAQAGGVDGHVRPRLVDDPDHAQRHAHLADLDARGHIAHVADLADRVGQRGDLAQALDHVVDARRGQRQAVQHRRLQAIGAAGGEVLLVGVGQLRAGGVQRIGRGQQGAVLLRGGAREQPRGGAGIAAQAAHIVEDGLGHGLGIWRQGNARL